MHAESEHDDARAEITRLLHGAEDRTLDCMRGSRNTLERGRAMLARLRGKESETAPRSAGIPPKAGRRARSLTRIPDRVAQAGGGRF
jgi:hypothetical protein